jgi:hypothetical protein
MPKLDIYGPNLNPPISIPFFAVAAQLELSLFLWRVISAVIYLSVIIFLVFYYKINFSPVLFPWLLLQAGLWQVIGLGQIQAPLLIATSLAIIFLHQKRYILSGIFIGALVTVKPNFIVWPLLLFLSGQLIAPIVASITIITISLVPVLIYGPYIYAEWLGVHQAYNVPEKIGMGINTSVIGFTTRHDLGTWGYIAGIALLLFLAWWVWQKRPDTRTVTGLGLTASLLVSPIAWIAYTLLLVPLFIKNQWSRVERMSAFLLIMPEMLVWLCPALGASYLAALILLFIHYLKRENPKEKQD